MNQRSFVTLRSVKPQTTAVLRRSFDVVVVPTGRFALQFKAGTLDVSIVTVTSDPVAFRLIDNLARPGGNITGLCRRRRAGADRQALHRAAPSVVARSPREHFREAEFRRVFTAFVDQGAKGCVVGNAAENSRTAGSSLRLSRAPAPDPLRLPRVRRAHDARRQRRGHLAPHGAVYVDQILRARRQGNRPPQRLPRHGRRSDRLNRPPY